jgi:hypothetical protein
MEFEERRAPMATSFMIASVLEVGLVVVAAAIFVTMIVAAFAAVIWFVGGLLSATRQSPTPRH